MKLLLFGIALSVLTGAAYGQISMKFPNSYYQPENWPRHTLTITREGTLKDVFDAGLRPHFIPGFATRSVEFKHVRLHLRDSTGRLLPEFPIEYSEIKVKPSGMISLVMKSQPLTIEQSKDEMTRWLPFIGMPSAQLDEFLRQVAEDPAGYDDPHFGKAPAGFEGTWTGADDILYGVKFQKAYNPSVPVRIYLSVVWHRVRSDKERFDSYEQAITSPGGYEDCPIKEGKDFGQDDTSEMMMAKGITPKQNPANDDNPASGTNRFKESNLPKTPDPTGTREKAKTLSEVRERTPVWPVIVGVALLTAIITWLFRASKKRGRR